MQKFGRYLITALLVSVSLFIAGCNTVHGFGQDMQAGGQAIEKAAVKNS